MSVAPERVRELIALGTMDGRTLRLEGQLDRAEYAAVDKVLRAAGGKWDRKARAHVFPGSPVDALGEFLGGGSAPKPARRTEGYVATPDRLAGEVVDLLRLRPGMSVLEPSAGCGALLRAVLRTEPDITLTAVEPNADRVRPVARELGLTVFVQRFEDYAREQHHAGRRFDRVVMNPPFAIPGEPAVWIDHVRLAWSLLAPAGRLVSIVPAGFAYRKDDRHVAMRKLVAEHGGWSDIAPGAFRPSGTDVHAAVLWLDAA